MKILSATPKALVNKLVFLITKASEVYYASEGGDYYKSAPMDWPHDYFDVLKKAKGVITDAVFDLLWNELKRLDPTNKALKQTGAQVKNKKMRIKLPYPMPSLDKIKTPTEVQNWLDTHPGPYVVSGKKDGVSIGMRFGKGVRMAFTKGRDNVGGDISFMMDALRIPKTPLSIDVRGEMIVKKTDFEKLYRKTGPKDKDGFENPRAMVSGITNRDTLHPGLKHTDVLVYELVNPRKKPSEALQQLKSIGFKTVPHKVFKTLTAAQLPKILAELRSKLPYELDGLVITQDKKTPAPTASNPDHSIAYKDPTAYELADVEVINVEWNVTRTGYLFPRINIKPTRIGGVTVTYCSGKSGMTIKKNNIGPGAVIRVQRAGDVIPDFVQTVKKVKPQMPAGGENEQWEWNGENIRLLDIGHDTAKLKQIEHFFTVIGVENFKAATIQKFIDAGLDNIHDICNSTAEEWAEVPGTNRNIKTVHAQMDACLNGIQLSKLMYASGVFGRAMGERRFEAVLTEMPNLLTYTKPMTPAQVTDLIKQVRGFDTITAKQIAVGLKPFRIWLKHMPSVTKYVVGKPKIKLSSTKMKDQYVVFTGVRDTNLNEWIVKNGGEVGDSATKMTILIAKDPNSTSSKLNAARAKGVKIYSIEQFRKQFGAK